LQVAAISVDANGSALDLPPDTFANVGEKISWSISSRSVDCLLFDQTVESRSTQERIQDPLLRRAEQFFFEALFVDPMDCSALNGLGSILILERELEAAEFFVRRAIAIAKKKKMAYLEAEHDLAMITYYKTHT